MNIFEELQRRAGSIHTKRQSNSYKKLIRGTKRACLQKEKLSRIAQARAAKAAEVKALKDLRPKRRFPFKLPKSSAAVAQGIPSDKELNRAIFGSPTPKRPKGVL